MKIRLTHLDGKLPNLALMKLSHWYKANGADVYFSKSIYKKLDESYYDEIFGSSIFTFSKPSVDLFRRQWPSAVIGGTGTDNNLTVEQYLEIEEYEHYDYSIYPEYKWSIGFTQRGCRLSCKFCVVPQKEGKPRSINSIYDIWRRDTPKCVCLLDNDFFGQPKMDWNARVSELMRGNFKVCFNQGINVRLIDNDAAEALSQLQYYDDQFKTRRLYTAWDNLRDEEVFISGVHRLFSYGIPPKHLMVYMLVGYDPSETWERIFHRYNVMKELGVNVYPMVYQNNNKELKRFQRWVVRRYAEFIEWENFK